ncbi:MAG: D-amino acid aminotransferase [Gammaproteobacteria bacterium]
MGCALQLRYFPRQHPPAEVSKDMTIVYLNGEFTNAADARISPMDRGFLFADGVYEVIPVFDGRPLGLNEHLRRLEYSLEQVRMARPAPRATLAALILEMVARNGGGNLAVYLQVTRGAPERRDHAFPVPAAGPTIFMTASALGGTAIDDPDGAAGASAITAEDPRWLRCDIKSVALLPNVLMRQRAVEAQAAETIMVRQGQLTEGSSTNVFIVKQGRISTPPLSPLLLAGITRAMVLEICRGCGMAVEERPISGAELAAADEIWVTSSTKDVLPIVKLDGRTVGAGRPGPVWKALAVPYLEHKRRN